MPGWNFFGLICGAAAVSLFAAAHRLARERRPRHRWVVIAWLFVPALPALHQAAYYLHVLPEDVWFYEARSRPGFELVTLPLGAWGGLVAAALPRRALIVPLLATSGAVLGPFLKPVLAPLPEREFREVWVKDVCIQSTLATCGPASLATVWRSFGHRETERDIARAVHSYRGGTEAWYLARHVRSRGFEAVFRREPGFPEAARWPAIVGVTVDGGRGHFIPILGREGELYFVGDPMIGPERLTRTDLERRYGFTGFVLEVSRAKGV